MRVFIGRCLQGLGVLFLALLTAVGWAKYTDRDLVRPAMFTFVESPLASVEQTAAVVQANIIDYVRRTGRPWSISGAHYPGLGAYSNVVPPVIDMHAENPRATSPVGDLIKIELCNPEYSRPILENDRTKYLSAVMPCGIQVLTTKDEDGVQRIWVVLMNVAGMAHGLPAETADIMAKVAEDQRAFVDFDRWLKVPEDKMPQFQSWRSAPQGKGTVASGC